MTPVVKIVKGDGPTDDEETKTATPVDAGDFADLWVDPGLADGITSAAFTTIVVGKPKEFFRVSRDPAFRRRTELYTHKPEGSLDEQHYIIAAPMRGLVDEAQPCTIVTCTYRDGTPRLWPIKLPKDGSKDFEAWISARAAAREAFDHWVRITWVRNAYKIRTAEPGYAPDPDWGKLPPFNDLVTLAFGPKGVIRDENHPVYRDLLGKAEKKRPTSIGDDGEGEGEDDEL